MEMLKFKEETQTLKNFFEVYCENKHNCSKKIKKELKYKEQIHTINLKLCDNCIEKIDYCFERLQECPHEEKPRCRSCKNPCYEKRQWKETAKIMKYSGIRLGLSSIKRFLKFSS